MRTWPWAVELEPEGVDRVGRYDRMGGINNRPIHARAGELDRADRAR